MEKYTCDVCECEFKLKVLVESEAFKERTAFEGFCCPCCSSRLRTRLLTNEDVVNILTDLKKNASASYLQGIGINKDVLNKSIILLKERILDEESKNVSIATSSDKEQGGGI